MTMTDDDLDELLDDSPPDPGAGGGDGGAEDDEAQPIFDNVEDFVVEYLSPLICRRLNGTSLTWCPDWFLHAEAISRLNAMWRSWEHLRLEGALGSSSWWLHHADPHLGVLLNPDTGPFAACSPTDGHSKHPLDPLPVNRADPRLWLGTAFSTTAAARRALAD
ncbi:DUF4913 domain-containing protein [Kitasatospora kifunensis]|uniref:DUF4913 domain-containing protein n=1 Tax=Kitasatospora kifunensis TaxID=58351 RepID=A0A7W7RBU3_KITKI|nr:DUF4913 domain-containing protein [Kitasatospora kifunensis]MBB4929049.1 hypothetical protein [Kitasatospora kifunensis]